MRGAQTPHRTTLLISKALFRNRSAIKEHERRKIWQKKACCKNHSKRRISWGERYQAVGRTSTSENGEKWASCLARSPAAKSGFTVRSLPLLRNLLLSPTVYIIRSQLSIVFRCSRDLIGNNSGQDKTGFDPQMQGAPTFWTAGTSTGTIVWTARTRKTV